MNAHPNVSSALQRDMDNHHAEVKKYSKKNFAINAADGVLFFFALTFLSNENVIPVFLNSLGAQTFVFALIPFLVNFGTTIPVLFVAHRLESKARKKPFVILFGIIQRAPWVFVVLSGYFLAETYPNIVIIVTLCALCIRAIGGGLNSAAWLDLVTKVTPLQIRGRLFAVRGTGGYLCGFAGGFLVTAILRFVDYPLNFSLLFTIGLGILAISLIPLFFLEEPVYPVRRNRQEFITYIKSLPNIIVSNSGFRNFIIARACYMLAFVSTAFFAVSSINKFDLDAAYAGVFTMIGVVVFIVINPVLAVIADRVGFKLNFIIGSIALSVSCLLAIVGNFYVMFAIFVGAAISQAVKMHSEAPMSTEFCAPEERMSYIAAGALMLAPISLLGLGMGAIAQHFGTTVLFGITGTFALVASLLFIFVVREPRKAQGTATIL